MKGGNPGHQLYAAWAAAAAAAALASHQGHPHGQTGHLWPGSPLSHAAFLQHQQNRDEMDGNRDRDRGESFD